MDSLVIDGIDRAILAELRIDGRASWRELGERVGLGPTATADRVRRLERHGVIRGYHADIDLSVLGIGLRAITELQLEAGADHDEFEAELRRTPEVRSASHVTGAHDYLLHLACPDVAALDRLLTGWKLSGATRESSTRIILHDVDLTP
ncbi:MAG TPA: Lrp/AsnC family transcriptional regulator [Microthrixaceae bacterium]|nr:Lrp/AsnC family transcriptional regulator [Microthrixaceae bacterium]MCB9402577.1 Lrp/AsnC family transcriptional regulator [Microthrixaceae bacterium]MCO5305996.1 Lrp/AsnC family transcriptional regulator [Microthrixaceae bacterium]HPG15459.1 Lrp/AsnC family transcriptional regulator [Microthrixaceae bacterium]HRW41222.1 Lrp/AsnC family transcriptional regulator [Microthrixaceae bacterium]